MGSNWNMIGHEWAVAALEHALGSNRLGHALLISGPAQVGKSTLALRLAQALNCERGPAPCGECRACRRIASGNFPDVRIGGLAQQTALQKPGESVKARLGIDAVREWQSNMHLRPYDGQRRVFILHDAETMTEQASNALLKTLEEPPPYATLILVAHGSGDLLPTITSRCHSLKLRPLPRQQIVTALQDRWSVAPDDAEIVAAWSGGRLGWALHMAQEPVALQVRMDQRDALIELQAQSLAQRFKWVESISKKGSERDEIIGVLELWQSWWRDVLLVAAGVEDSIINIDRLEELRQLRRLPLPAIHATLQRLDQASVQIRENVSPQLALEQIVLGLPTA